MPGLPMPTNTSPEYKKAEEWFRSASTDDEKLLALEDMLRTIPKHKGTEHMRADLNVFDFRLAPAEVDLIESLESQ